MTTQNLIGGVGTEAAEPGREAASGPRPKAADRIRAAATELFYRQGIRATGVEEVCRAAGATKMSLYRAYPSKDALVAAILDESAAEGCAWFEEAIAAAPTPAAKLRAAMEAYAAFMAGPDLCGCPLSLAQAEFRDPAHPTHRLVAEHKTEMREALAGLARDAGAADPELLGDVLTVLIDGAWSTLPYMGGTRAAEVLRQAAETAIRQALP